MTRVVHPGFGYQIRILIFYPSRIPEPGVKRHRIPDLYPQHWYRYYLTFMTVGRHLVISLKPNDVDSQAELLYLPRKSVKPRSCLKFKGNLVSAVAFRYPNVFVYRQFSFVIYESEF
jgi:hypothetical protein